MLRCDNSFNNNNIFLEFLSLEYVMFHYEDIFLACFCCPAVVCSRIPKVCMI